jgi:hypothetical protein
MTVNLIIVSHSDYAYLWDIIEEYTHALGDLNPIFVSNKNDRTISQLPKGFCKYIYYDDTLCYAQRWINILKEIDSNNIIVVHDVCIIIDCNVQKIQNLIQFININDIDRCSLNVFDGIDVLHGDENYVCNLNNNVRSNTFVPYDLCPTIWKKSSFNKLWETFPQETYHHSELNAHLQNYCKQLKCYGLQKTADKIFYCIGRPYSQMFKILHITIKGQIQHPKEVQMDALSEFDKIYEKYDLKNKITINCGYQFILNNFSPL